MSIVFVDSGIMTLMMNIKDIDGKLADLEWSFYAKDFPAIEAAFKLKYGKPAVSQDVPWQSKGGAKTLSHHREFHYGPLRLFLQSPATQIDLGWMKVATVAYLEAERRRDADTIQKGADDL
jgi:hypothetical protein